MSKLERETVMGMAASQARFLGLTARKTNIEYEGQQINQQRTALSNQTASYYTDLLGMAVPVCPSVDDYTQTIYSFNDGSLENTITSLIAQPDGSYNVSYLRSYNDDYSVVAAGATSVVKDISGAYLIGGTQLKGLGDNLKYAYIIREMSETYRLYEDGDNYNYTDKTGNAKTLIPTNYDIIVGVIGAEPQPSDFNVGALCANYTATQCYADVNGSGTNGMYHMEHNLCKLMWSDGTTSITSSSGVTLTRRAPADVDGYSLTTSMSNNTTADSTCTELQAALKNYWPETYQRLVDTYINAVLHNDIRNTQLNKSLYTLSSEEGDAHVREVANAVNPAEQYTNWQGLWTEIAALDYNDIYNKEHERWQREYDKYTDKYVDSVDHTKFYTLTERQMYYDGDDEYLKSLSSDQLENLYWEEVTYRDMLEEKYGASENGWLVRYKQNTSTGAYEPNFYRGDDIVNGFKDDYNSVITHVDTYKIGKTHVQNEVKGKEAVLEQDSTGRYINITFLEPTGNKTYALSTSTVKDEDAYNDAMNQYEYDKAMYENRIQEINAKIEIIQAEDKNLELRLKQLDTEQDAVSNELDAVQKVIEKNVESSFKTFG